VVLGLNPGSFTWQPTGTASTHSTPFKVANIIFKNHQFQGLARIWSNQNVTHMLWSKCKMAQAL
jgi:hypothetical protein